MFKHKYFYQNSKLEKEYLEYLESPQIMLVSFDIFETLVFRKVSKPHDIFLKVGKNKFVKKIFKSKYLFKEYRVKAERLARELRKTCQDDITLKDIYKQLPITEKQQNIIMNIELSVENKNLYINRQIEEWIYLAHKYNKKIILISDIYLSNEHIDKLVLSKLKNKNIISDIFISSEYKVAKFSGKLFHLINEKLEYTFNEQLHIGDNNNSDIIVPQKMGINTIYYNLNNYALEMQSFEYKYLNNKFPKYNNLRVLSCILNPYFDEKSTFFYTLGSMIYGPILWYFSNWILDIYKKYNLEQINFVMREGQIFGKCLTLLNPNIDINLIYASRHSTYLACLDIDELLNEDDNTFINNYLYQSICVEDFYKLLKINITNDIIYKHKNLFVGDTKLIQVNNISLLKIIYDDIKLNELLIKRNIEHERMLISKYIEDLGVKHNSIIIDFGSTGTVLKRLENICRVSKLNGLFYMSEQGLDNAIKKITLSFFHNEEDNTKNIKSLYRSPAATEVLFNGLEDTTIGYEEIQNIVKAITKPTEQVPSKIIESFNYGIEVFFEMAKLYKLEENKYKSEELIKLLSRVIELPTIDEANFLGNLTFDIGAGRNVKVKKIVDLEEQDKYYKDNLYINHLNYFNYKKEYFEWVEGFITQINQYEISLHKGIFDLRDTNIAITNLVNTLKNNNIEEIYIFGTGDFFKKLLPKLDDNNVKVLGLIDSKAISGTYRVDKFIVDTLENTIVNNSNILIASGAFIDPIHEYISECCHSHDISVNIIDCINGIVKV
ncbi:hypothetical protein [Arcobacter sp.]|uniref:hypothetical protein n=1 Tax=unclassified Arcobacter TaxID=2593671 RepID=UPI003B003C1D